MLSQAAQFILNKTGSFWVITVLLMQSHLQCIIRHAVILLKNEQDIGCTVWKMNAVCFNETIIKVMLKLPITESQTKQKLNKTSRVGEYSAFY